MIERKRFVLLGAAVMCLALSGPSLAQDTDQEQARVKTDDLNLHTAAGRATFDGRVRAAADSVCGGAGSGVRDLANMSAERDCRARAMRNGAAQADAIVARQDAAERARMARAHASPNRTLKRARAHHRLARHRTHKTLRSRAAPTPR